MSVFEFINLSLDERANAILKGTLIANRYTTEQMMLLFTLEDFFVEVTYDLTDNQVTRIKPFQSSRRLAPYLDSIDISEITG